MGLGSWDSWRAVNSGMEFENYDLGPAPSFAAVQTGGSAAVAGAMAELATGNEYGQEPKPATAQHQALAMYQGYFSQVRD